MCTHEPRCPGARDSGREAARLIAAHPEQGWALLCNGVVIFDDTGELLPDGGVVAPHRPAVSRTAAATQTCGPELKAVIARLGATRASLGLHPVRVAVTPRVKVVSAREADKH